MGMNNEELGQEEKEKTAQQSQEPEKRPEEAVKKETQGAAGKEGTQAEVQEDAAGKESAEAKKEEAEAKEKAPEEGKKEEAEAKEKAPEEAKKEPAAEAEEELEEEPPFLVTESEKLNKKALRRAIKKDQTTSMLVKLESDRQINKAMSTIDKGFDHRLIAVINRWSTSEHPEREADRIKIDGKKASLYMKENGYTFMDCVLTAQSAIEKNKPRVEIDVELSDEKGRFDRKMNLSDPGFKNIPPSHMPKFLNNLLQVVTLGFFQNRADRKNHKKELEMIRFAAIEKEKLSRIKENEKKAADAEARRKKAQNKEIATKALERQAEEKQYQYDKKHSREKLQEMDTFRKEATEKMAGLAKRKAELAERAKACQAKMKELGGAGEEVKKWLEKNKDTGWEKDPEKKKALAEMMEKVNEYTRAREEYGHIGRDMARVQRSAEKLMVAVGVREGKRPRLTELYQKQGDHTLTEEERKELEELEKPGVIKGFDSSYGRKDVAEELAAEQGEKELAEAEKESPEKEEEAKKESPEAEKEAAPAEPKKETPEAEKEAASAEPKKESPEAGKKAAPAEPKKEGPEAEKKTAPAEAEKKAAAAEPKKESPEPGKTAPGAGRKDSATAKEAEKKAEEKKAAEKRAAEKSRQPDKKSGKKGPSRRR